MKQHSILFKRCDLLDDSVATQLNNYLKEHPNYTVSNIVFNDGLHTIYESLLVVFNIEEDIKD